MSAHATTTHLVTVAHIERQVVLNVVRKHRLVLRVQPQHVHQAAQVDALQIAVRQSLYVAAALHHHILLAGVVLRPAARAVRVGQQVHGNVAAHQVAFACRLWRVAIVVDLERRCLSERIYRTFEIMYKVFCTC